MALSQILVNGAACSWGNITVKFDGISVAGLTEISYGDSVEESREAGMGLAHRPTRRSSGKYTTDEVTLRGFASDIDAIIKLAAVKSTPPGNWSGSFFTVVVQFAFMPSEPVRTHTLHECRILAVPHSFTEGAEVIKDELRLGCMWIDRDGITGYSRVPQL